MEFSEFKQLQQKHIASLLKNATALFEVDIDKDALWDLYLDSFPPGTNEIFRERREYDCSCCRHFVKQFGNIVAIVDYQPVSIWDFETNDDKFQPVLNALSDAIKHTHVSDVFITKESAFGTDKSYEQLTNGDVHTWHHFRAELPARFVVRSHKTTASITAEYRDIKNVFQRSLTEITQESIETVLDLIAEKTLYKGDEWRGLLEKFLALHNEYHSLELSKRDNFCWLKSVEIGGAIGKIRNHSIGVLLSNISNGANLDEAVRKYEAIVAPTNYKRPKAIFTKKMVEQAQKAIEELGFLESLKRRHATLSDITVNNVLWVNRNAIPYMDRGNIRDVFELLKKEATEPPKKFDNVPGISIEKFVRDVLPTASSIEVLVENKHESNLMTLIAPKVPDSKTMFKWDNNFSWAYNGNITDSMKERVRAMGGKVEGVLRASLQWSNGNDFDLHCIEPNGNHIYYYSKGRRHSSSGMLDVDIIDPRGDQRVVDGVAVENIIYSNKSRMPEGVYHIFIHNYNHRGGKTGFQAEIEYDGQIYSYNYPHELQQGENVTVAKFMFNKNGIKFIESLPSTTASKTIWNLATNQFHPVTAFMFSPNYWNNQTGIGHKHYFFVVSGCKTDDQPNGFFNEFLKEDLMEHKRVFEALGNKMKVEVTDNQLSGLGFSSTQRNFIVCRVDNQKIIKVIF